MTPTKFTKQLVEDIHNFLKQNTKVFANERDLQMNLAVYLENIKQYHVEVEYHVSSDIISTLLPQALPASVAYYPWHQVNSDKPQEMYLDIVVSNGQEYVPIELKYKKRKLNGIVNLFGQNMGNGVVLKEDSAQDFSRYGFWKDIRRLEFLTKAFNNVKNGIVLFVTNNALYKTASGVGTHSENFAMGNGTKTYHKDMNCSWPFNPLVTESYKSCPCFKLEKEHDVNWSDYTYNGVDFHCAEVII